VLGTAASLLSNTKSKKKQKLL